MSWKVYEVATSEQTIRTYRIRAQSSGHARSRFEEGHDENMIDSSSGEEEVVNVIEVRP